MEKICTICGKLKDIEEFSWKNKAKGKKRSECKDCVRKKDKERYNLDLQRRESIKKAHKALVSYIRSYVQLIKETSKCSICGESRWYVLDFHHLDNKDFNISLKIQEGCSLETILSEIKKCVIVCANCHREIHYQQHKQ